MPRGGRIAAGLGLVSIGAALLGVGIMQPAWAGDAVTAYPLRNVVVGGGVGIVGGGMLLVMLSFTGRKAEVAVLPAEVAFARPTTPRYMAPPQARAAAKRDAQKVALPISRLSSPEEIALNRITAEIRELTRTINKAGVLLATGQISSQGYAQYVDELKAQRGLLEKDRVQLEMRNHKLM